MSNINNSLVNIINKNPDVPVLFMSEGVASGELQSVTLGSRITYKNIAYYNEISVRMVIADDLDSTETAKLSDAEYEQMISDVFDGLEKSPVILVGIGNINR